MTFVPESDVQRRFEGVRREVREEQADRPRPLPWLGKRLLLLALASCSAGYVFHLCGTWPFGIVATVTPVFGWIALILAMQRQFGAREGRIGLLNSGVGVHRPGHASAKAHAELAMQIDHKRRFGV